MGLFSKSKKNDGWLTIAFLGDGICTGSVKRVRDGKAVVAAAAFYPAVPSHSPEVLERLARDARGKSRGVFSASGDGGQHLN